MTVETLEELSIAYTPGVASVCMAIHADRSESYNLTNRGNTIAVVTDGSAVLGLGNIGAEAAMPVMEGKSILFKALGGVDAYPICVASQDPDTIISTVRAIAALAAPVAGLWAWLAYRLGGPFREPQDSREHSHA